MIDAHLGPYELREAIGQGGMATVYRAYHPAVDRYVAVKVIHAAILHDERALDRFRREARLIARLEHPHILPVYDFDGSHAPPYIVMRYLDSGTLRDLLAHQRLPLPAIADLLTQVAAALDYAHAQGIVHRDIKPSNILLDRHGNAFVSDFGIARIVAGQPSGDQPLTQTGAIVGTPDYMAPEQAQGRGDIDGRADVYALGVMLFQLLTGRLPFVSDQPLSVLLQHIQAPIPSAHRLNPLVPIQIDALLRQALAKEPAERFASAGALATEFTKLGRAGGTASSAATLDLRGVTSLLRIAEPAAPPTPTPSEQHKVVTACHTDAADYAEIVEARQGAEAARQAIHTLWERATQIIAARGGSVLARNEHSLTAIWGAATAREDDPERAIHAALDMHAALRDLGAGQFEERDDEPLPMATGVNTGVALIAPGDQPHAYTATGATISLAQRLAAHAAGAILIGHDTFREVRGVFDMEPEAPLTLRGRKGAVETYRVVAARTRAARVAARGVEGVATRMIGRTAELAQLQSAWLDAVEDSETQMVTLIGEAGLGKSRLLDEFDKWADLRPEEYWIFRGRATPATTRRPYALLRDMLAFRFEILDNDPVALVRQKLEIGVAEVLGAADAETAHLIGHLAGFDLRDSPHVRGLLGDPAQLAGRARQLLGRLFARMAALSPIVIELEDLHHADDASLDLANDLVAAARNLPLLLVCLARPALLERRPDWGSGQQFHRRIVLAPLDKRGSRDLAREILQKVVEVPKALRDLLVERAEGNPLYMEELVKMLIEDRAILKESAEVWRVETGRLAGLRVPSTLRGLLQARFDTLLYPEKLTLQRAAVIGRIFFDSALLALDTADTTHVGDLPGVLGGLAAREFLHRRETSSFAGSVEYIFAQAMLRDLIYETLISRQRQTYHAALAGWIEAGERAEEYLPLIAEHYEQAGDAARAAHYLERAGDKAMALSAYAEALGFYTRALALADEGPKTKDQGQRTNTDEPSSVAGRQSSLLVKQAEAHLLRSDFFAARATLERALGAAQTDVERATALALLGEMTSENGDYAGAWATLEEALPPVRASDDRAALARVLYGLGDVAWRQGRLNEARAYLDESLALARALGDTTRTMFALNRLGAVALNRGDLDEAERLLTEVHALALAVGNRERAMHALNNLGEVAKQRSNLVMARAYHQQALDLAREIGARQQTAGFLLNLADDDIKLRDLGAARAELRQGLALARTLGVTWVLTAVPSYCAHLAAAEGDMVRALALYGLARRHPAWSGENQRELERDLAAWGLDAAVAEAGLARGAELDFDATVAELLGEG